MTKFYLTNITNLELLIEDDDFWQNTLPKVITFTIDNIHAISSKVRLLIANESQVVELSRKDILLIISSMFLGIMPMQMFDFEPHFGHLFCMS
jgi:hypothetical protein